MGRGFKEGTNLSVEVREEGECGGGGDGSIDTVAAGDGCEPWREELGIGLSGAEFYYRLLHP